MAHVEDKKYFQKKMKEIKDSKWKILGHQDGRTYPEWYELDKEKLLKCELEKK